MQVKAMAVILSDHQLHQYMTCDKISIPLKVNE